MKPKSSDSREPAFFPSPAHSRIWLEEAHEMARELLVGFHKRDSDREKSAGRAIPSLVVSRDPLKRRTSPRRG